MNIIRCTNKWIAQTFSLLPDLGRRWREASDEGWRSLYFTNDKRTHSYKNLLSSHLWDVEGAVPYALVMKLLQKLDFIFVIQNQYLHFMLDKSLCAPPATQKNRK